MEVREGAVVLDLPDRDLSDAGPAERAPAFYNPAMATSRDLGVLVHRVLADASTAGSDAPPVRSVLDGLAGAGARGLRIAAEAAEADTDEAPVEVVLNDADPTAHARIVDNIATNGLDDRARALNMDLRDVLSDPAAVGGPWDAVDVDPYGSPAMWVGPALEVLPPGGVLGLAATDTAVLTGLYPETLEDRYGARMVRQEADKEVGLRILLGFVARTAAKAGRGVEVLLAYRRSHHMRAWVRVGPEEGGEGARGAGTDASGEGTARRCPACGAAWMEASGDDPGRLGTPCACGEPTDASGPLWTGPLLDADLLSRLETDLSTLAKPRRTRRLVSRLEEEAGAPPLYADLHKLAKRLACSVPAFDDVRAALEERGYTYARTHFEPTAVRTDAPRKELADAVAALGGG